MSKANEEKVKTSSECNKEKTGFGMKKVKTLKQTAIEFENQDGTKFMTNEEIEDMKKNIHFEYEPKFIHRNERRISLPETRLRFKNPVNSPEIMQKSFDQFIRYCLGKAGGDLQKTRMSFGFYHEGFQKSQGFWISERTYETFNGQVLFEELERISQSKEDVEIDDTFHIRLHIFTDFDGAGRRRSILFDDQLKIPAYVVGNGKCLPKAVALAMIFFSTKVNNDQLLKWKRMTHIKFKYQHEKTQLEAANDILKKSGFPSDQEIFNLDDLEKISKFYPDYKFEVYTRPSYQKFYQIIKELNGHAEKIVTIAFKKEDGVGHYDFIKPSLAHMKSIFCHKCKKNTSSTGHSQVCDAKCDKCGFYECENIQIEVIYCEKCNTNFSNKDCLNNHLQCAYSSKKPMCEKRYTCLTCNYRVHKDKISQDDVHQCEKRARCMQCMQLFDKTSHHDCCFQPPRKRLREKKMVSQKSYKILCYDVESIVANSSSGADYSKSQTNHEVNLICYKMCCNVCVEKREECSCESGHFHYTEHSDPLQEFVNFLLFNKTLDGAYVIAHNGGRLVPGFSINKNHSFYRYDHNFVLSRIVTFYRIIPEYVSNGTSLIMANISKLTWRNTKHNSLKFRDSLRFIPMPLSKMPKTFGITEMRKGYYPYYFNHKENYGKVLNGLPPKHFYDPDHMKLEVLSEFEKWYEVHKYDVFNADQELLSYCQSDVEILTAGISEYIKICKKLFNGWNPILSACTIAGFVQHILKFEHFREGDLGIIPENGWPENNNSVFALKTLLWLEKQSGVYIHHKLRGKEKLLEMPNGDRIFVDGFDEKSKTVFEIHGCFHHGCPKCTNPTLMHPYRQVENKSVYDSTIRRENRIRDAGYKLVSWWEHDIREMLRHNSEMREFFKKCRHATHLIPREGMYGGRTQPFQMIVECGDDEECCYDDYNSLYPSVNIMHKYPRGQPIVLKNSFPPIISGELLEKKGLYLCSIIAPPDIKITVLPYKIPGFLTFPSCRTCIESTRKTACNHDKVSERYLTGIWTHVEVNAAITRGYRLLQFHEIWWWPDNKWETADYFVNYLKSMIKLKHESSGWPRDDMTDDEKLSYIDEIFQRDGVLLDKDNVKKADNMREMSKLYLNTCWGKFAENPVRVESRIFATQDAVAQSEYMSAQGYETKLIDDWDEGITVITRSSKTETVKTKNFANIVIGIYTTSYARLRLLQAMEVIGSEDLIYVDTDSVIYKKKIGALSPVRHLIGDGLGKLKPEIPRGYQIKKIICMASKVYSYCLRHIETGEEKTVTKFKGLALNSSNMRIINMETMEASVSFTQLTRITSLACQIREFLAGRIHMMLAPDRTMRRLKILGSVTSSSIEKKLKPVMDKVHVLLDGKTLPSGYFENCDLVEDYPY